MKELTIELTGLAPLLMHSDRLANPLDPCAVQHKKLTAKKTKTEDDHRAIAKSDFVNALYCDADGPYLPTINIRAALIGGAKRNKRGTQMRGGTMILADKAPLRYDGPRDPEALWALPAFIDARGVTNRGTSRVIRYRPCFRQWAAAVTITYDPSVVEAEHILHDLDTAGRYIGLGDFRPEKGGIFGRFAVEARS